MRFLMPNRTICDVLEAMRKCGKTRNFSYLPGLIEEAQDMANRMESKLWDQKDLEQKKEDLDKREEKLNVRSEETRQRETEDGTTADKDTDRG